MSVSPLARRLPDPDAVREPDAERAVEPTTVGVIAQDPVTFAGVAGALRDVSDVRLAPCGGERLPEVVVVAADTGDQPLVRTVGTLRARDTAVVAVVADLDPASLLAVVEAGAAVVVPRREATGLRLAEAIRSAASGSGSIPAEWLRRLVAKGDDACDVQRDDATRPASRPEPSQALSERELVVLRLLADGFSTAEIASELAYSESTIKLAIHELTSRLRLRNRSHAVAFALRAGLI
jgi:DNA-binding NarL/FixJ family response regulator